MSARAAGALLAVAAAAALLWLALGTAPDLPERPRAQEDWSGDFRSYYLPNAEFATRRAAEGALPLWYPYQGLGGPFLATLQAGVLYPPNALHALLPAPTAFLWLAVLHLALAVCSAGWLALALGAGVLGAAVAGVAYATSLQVVASIWSPPVLYTLAWAPAVWLCVDRIATRPTPGRAVAFAGVVAVSLLAGWPYAFAITALGAAFYGGVLLVTGTLRRRGSPLVAAAALAFGAVAGVGLAAPQLLPTAELVARSVRALGSLVEGQAVFVGPPHDPAVFWHGLIARGFNDGVPGVVLLPLALLALLAPGPGRARVGVLLAAGVLGLMASFPNDLPVYRWLRELPLLGDFRFPYRYRLLTTLALAVAAGVGTTRLSGLLSRWRGAGAATGAAVLAACVASIALPSFRAVSPFARGVEREASLLPALRRAGVDLPDGKPGRIYWAGLAKRLHGLRDTFTLHDMEPLSLALTARLVTYFETGRPRTLLTLPHDITGEVPPGDFAASPYYGHLSLPRGPERAAILDLVSVTTIVAADPPAWLDERYRRVSAPGAALAVFENPHALPRAYRVPRAVREPRQPLAALRLLTSDGFDPRAQVMLSNPPRALLWHPGERQPASPGEVEVTRYAPEEVSLTTSGAEPGIVVLTDAYFPGWDVTLDGLPVPLHRANFALRAVAVPAGAHRIEMRYRPRSFERGLWLAAATAVACAALLLLARRLRD